MDTSTENLTLENFYEKTGLRFKVTKEQQARISAGELTREQALQEFVNSSALEKALSRKAATDSRPDIPDEVFVDPDLNLSNYREKVAQYGGPTSARFRRTKDQISRGLEPEEAFAEFLEQKRSNATVQS
jgi:hypothetical protein